VSKTKLNVVGKKVYVGIDVHKKTFTATAIGDGVIVKCWTMKADGAELAMSLKKWFKGCEIHTAYEAGFSGFGLHRILCGEGIKNIIVNPASIEVAANDKKKNDQRDSKKISEQLSVGRLKGIYIPTESEELNRQLSRTREQIVEHRACLARQIKSKLFHFGLLDREDDRVVSNSFLEELEKKSLPEMLKKSLSYLIEAWRFYTKQLDDLKIEFQAQSFEDAEREAIYRSVPGIGPVSARVLSNELGDLGKRFENQKSLFQFTGLTPSEHSSGENIRRGNIDRQGSARVRHILTEVAWRAIEGDGALKEVFDRIAATRGKKRAIVAIARKIIGRIRACFVLKQTYCVGLVA
jgi:transposase